MATATAGSREARRRRIAERGSDRLAFITGRMETLPSSSSYSSSFSLSPLVESANSDAPSSLPLISNGHDLQTHLSDQPPNAVIPQSEDKAFSLESDTVSDTAQHDTYDDGSSGGLRMRKCETSSEAFGASVWEREGKAKSSPLSSSVQNSSISAHGTECRSESLTNHLQNFTPSRISSAIAASESARMYCSLAAAILVVLSYAGFPIVGSHIVKSLIIFRPLYLILLTNISIVLALLLLGKHRGSEKNEQEMNNIVPSIGGYDLAEKLAKALESSLVLQNFMGAVLMDCSIYAIVVVCGLALAQRLSW